MELTSTIAQSKLIDDVTLYSILLFFLYIFMAVKHMEHKNIQIQNNKKIFSINIQSRPLSFLCNEQLTTDLNIAYNFLKSICQFF